MAAGFERAPEPMRVVRVLVGRDEVVYLQNIIEAYDGMAFSQTVEPDYPLEREGEPFFPGPAALVQLFTSRDFLPGLRELLKALEGETRLRFLEEFSEGEGRWREVGRGSISGKGRDDRA